MLIAISIVYMAPGKTSLAEARPNRRWMMGVSGSAWLHGFGLFLSPLRETLQFARRRTLPHVPLLSVQILALSLGNCWYCCCFFIPLLEAVFTGSSLAGGVWGPSFCLCSHNGCAYRMALDCWSEGGSALRPVSDFKWPRDQRRSC